MYCWRWRMMAARWLNCQRQWERLRNQSRRLMVIRLAGSARGAEDEHALFDGFGSGDDGAVGFAVGEVEVKSNADVVDEFPAIRAGLGFSGMGQEIMGAMEQLFDSVVGCRRCVAGVVREDGGLVVDEAWLDTFGRNAFDIAVDDGEIDAGREVEDFMDDAAFDDDLDWVADRLVGGEIGRGAAGADQRGADHPISGACIKAHHEGFDGVHS